MKRNKQLPTILNGLIACAAVTAVPAVAQEEPEFSEFRVFIEINATDGDAGLQVLIDGDEWKEATIRDPDGRQVYNVQGYASVRDQGLTENFFESAEPSCDEDPLTDFLERFPAGEYVVTGKTVDGAKIEGSAELTHDLPRAAINLAPVGGGVDPTNPVQVLWTPGAGLGNCPPNGAEIGNPALFGYQIVVEREEPEPLVVLTVDLPAGATQLTIPPEFLQAGAHYKYEVIEIESRTNDDGDVEKGNQTVSESYFCTFVPSPGNPCAPPD